MTSIQLKASKKKKSGFFWFFNSCCESRDLISSEEFEGRTRIAPLTSMKHPSLGFSSQNQSNVTTEATKDPSDITKDFDLKKNNLLGSTLCGEKTYPRNISFFLGMNSERIIAKIKKKKLLRNQANIDILNSLSTNSRELNQIRSPTFSNMGCCKKAPSSYLENITKLDYYSPRKDSSPQREYFSMYDKGIKVDEWNNTTPENIAAHIAQKLKCNLLIDALCGVGSTTIQVTII